MKHIKKIQTVQTSASSGAQGDVKGEIRATPSLGGGCIPVGT